MQAKEDPRQLERLSTMELLFQNIDYALDMFLIYALTLSIFPGFLSEDTGSHGLGAWLVFNHILLLWSLFVQYSFLSFPKPCVMIRLEMLVILISLSFT